MAIRVLEETGLLPHLNPGVLTWEEIQRLKPVSAVDGHDAGDDGDPAVVASPAARTSARRTRSPPSGCGCWRTPAAPPSRSPPACCSASARTTPSGSTRSGRSGRRRSGTGTCRRSSSRTSGPSRARRCRRHDDLDLQEYVAAVAVDPAAARPEGAGAGAAEPVGLHRARAAAARRRRRLGRRLAADARPRQPRAAVAEHRRAGRADRRGRVRAARAAGRPAAVRAGSPSRGWTRGCARTWPPSPAPTGSRVEGRCPVGLPWQEPDEAWTSSGPGRPARRGRHRRPHRPTGAATSTPSTATGRSCASGPTSARDGHSDRAGRRRPRGAAPRCCTPSTTRPGSPTPSTSRCCGADGADLEHLCALADAVRADVNGDDVTYVVNRNINFTNVCYTGCRFCAFAQRRTDADAYTLSMAAGRRPGRRGVGGRRHRDLHAGRHPPRPARHRVLRPRPRGEAAAARTSTCTRSARWRSSTAPPAPGCRSRDFLTAAKEAGLDSMPGTAAEILDDDVRWVLTKGKLPTATWLEIITHRAPGRHPDDLDDDVRPRRHPGALGRRTCARWPRLQDETGGFTEFVLLPFVHHNSPIYLAGVARPGPDGAGEPGRARASPGCCCTAGSPTSRPPG